MNTVKPLTAEHGVITVDGMYVGQTAQPEVAAQLVRRFNVHDAMLRTLEQLRVQLTQAQPSDPATQETMLAAVNQTLVLAFAVTGEPHGTN